MCRQAFGLAFIAGATETAGSRRGISVHCVAWYRSGLPGQTVPMTSLSLFSWWNQEPFSWPIRYSSMYFQKIAYQSLYTCLPVTVASVSGGVQRYGQDRHLRGLSGRVHRRFGFHDVRRRAGVRFHFHRRRCRRVRFRCRLQPAAQRMTVINFRARDSTSRPKLNLGWKKIPAFG